MITIDLQSQMPLSDQISRELRRVIAEARVAVGDELPAVRQLAADLGVNFNTVARAYRTLEAGGLIRSARGRGTRVVSSVSADPEATGRRAVEALHAALVEARLAGFDRDRISTVLDRQIDALWPSDSDKKPTEESSTS